MVRLEEIEKRLAAILRDARKACRWEGGCGRWILMVGLSGCLIACVKLLGPHCRLLRGELQWQRRHGSCGWLLLLLLRCVCHAIASRELLRRKAGMGLEDGGHMGLG